MIKAESAATGGFCDRRAPADQLWVDSDACLRPGAVSNTHPDTAAVLCLARNVIIDTGAQLSLNYLWMSPDWGEGNHSRGPQDSCCLFQLGRGVKRYYMLLSDVYASS